MEILRRDHAVPILLGLPPRSWAALLRIVFGASRKRWMHTDRRDFQAFLRLLNSEALDSLREDDALMYAIRAAHPDKQDVPETSSAKLLGAGGAPDSLTPRPACCAHPPSPVRRAWPNMPTLGARLAAVSRQAQGLDSVVSDPAVLAELQELCAAPRPTRRVP